MQKEFEVEYDYRLIEEEAICVFNEYEGNTDCFDETGISLFRDGCLTFNFGE